MTKIAVSGASGRMGQAIIKRLGGLNEMTLGVAVNKGDDLNLVLDKFDLLIDFSSPEASLNYLKICAKNNKKIVIGTTGFDAQQLTQIDKFSPKIPIVLAPNTSVGVNLSLKLLAITAKMIGAQSDIEIIETHHRHKVDAPSGTALKMGEVLANTLGRKLDECAIYQRQGIGKARDKQSIGFSTIRGGNVVGEHTVRFFLEDEEISITHKATSRAVFAQGALYAASWLAVQNAGLYDMQDVLAF